MKTKKILSAVLALLLVFSLAACGSKVRADEKLNGKYIAVVGEMMGMSLTGEDINDIGIELQSGGKGSFTIDGETDKISWENDDTTISIKIDSETVTGTLGTDSFMVKDLLGSGMDLTFAKEGTDAAKPENYLPENDKFMLGNWQSTGVTDILGDPTDMDPYSLFMTFSADHTANVKFMGKDLGTFKWSLLDDWGSFDDEGAPDISWDIKDGGIEVSYLLDDEYYIFDCPKGGKIPDSAFGGSGSGSGGSLGSGSADDTAFFEFWENEYYGWWIIENAEGDMADLNENYYDVCGAIYFDEGSDDTGSIYLWDDTGNIDDPFCVADVEFYPDGEGAGFMLNKGGWFLGREMADGDLYGEPVTAFDHMITISGSFSYDSGSCDYTIYLKPWGMDWEDVREYNEALLPYFYDSWYTEAMYGVMPDEMPEY